MIKRRTSGRISYRYLCPGRPPGACLWLIVSKQLATDLAGESRVINMAAVATDRVMEPVQQLLGVLLEGNYRNLSPIRVKPNQLLSLRCVFKWVNARQEDTRRKTSKNTDSLYYSYYIRKIFFIVLVLSDIVGFFWYIRLILIIFHIFNLIVIILSQL